MATVPTASLRPEGAPRMPRAVEDFRLFIASVVDYAIFMLDQDGFVISWNAGAARLKGYKPPEILGRHFSTFYPAEEIEQGKPQRELEVALRDGRLEDEGWRVRKDGSQFWANVVITAIYDDAGQHVGFGKVTRDLTERRQAEQDRLRLAEAQEAVRLREEFLSIASHELRTPLNALHLYLQSAELVLRDDDAPVGDKLHKARRQVVRLMELIDRLLDVTRIARGQMKLKYESSDLAELAASAVDALRADADRVGSPILLEAPEGIVGFVDRLRIEQLVMNLVENAIKYSRGAPIVVTMARAGENAVIAVEDHGIGIDPSSLPRIFERFVRASPGNHVGGLGLGLYIAKHIVDAHCGSIRAESTAGVGARFTVSLPLRARPPEGTEDVDRAT